MDLLEILSWKGLWIFLVLSFIKIPKIELNVWGWIAKGFGALFNRTLNEKLDSLCKGLNELEKKFDNLQNRFDEHTENVELNLISMCRKRILRFNDELVHGTYHTKEHFDEIIDDIDKYEKYCALHEDFPNNKASISIENIKDVYSKCLKEHKFL